MTTDQNVERLGAFVADSAGVPMSAAAGYSHGDGATFMAAWGHVGNVMRAKHVARTVYYGAATQAAWDGASDEEIERILRGADADKMFSD